MRLNDLKRQVRIAAAGKAHKAVFWPIAFVKQGTSACSGVSAEGTQFLGLWYPTMALFIQGTLVV